MSSCSSTGAPLSLHLQPLSFRTSLPCRVGFPERLARYLDVSRQKLSPLCLETILDSQLPSPELSLKMPPKLSLPHTREGFFPRSKLPRSEGDCETIDRQKLSRGSFCPATSRCLFWPTGLGVESLHLESALVRTYSNTCRGNPEHPPLLLRIWGSPLFLKAPPTQFQPPNAKRHPPKRKGVEGRCLCNLYKDCRLEAANSFWRVSICILEAGLVLGVLSRKGGDPQEGGGGNFGFPTPRRKPNTKIHNGSQEGSA